MLLSIRDITRRPQDEELVRESEERLRSFIEQAHEGVSIVDEEGRISEWNAAQEKITGISRSEALGVCAWDLATRMILDGHHRDEICANMKESIRRMIRSGQSTQPHPVDYRFHRPDGTVAIARQNVFTGQSSHGTMVGTLNQDVTEQRQAEEKVKESEEKFRSLVEYALEAILILDFNGTVLLANQAAARLIEAETGTVLLGRNVMDYIAPESREEVMKDFVQIAQGHDAYLAQYTLISAKGNRIVVESIGKVVTYEGRPADLISLRNISERRAAEGSTSRE